MKDKKIKVRRIKLDSTVGEVIDKLVEESVDSILTRTIFRAFTRISAMIMKLYLRKDLSRDETVAVIKALKEPAAKIINEEFNRIEKFVRSFGEDENDAEHAKLGLMLFTSLVNESCLDFIKVLSKKGKRGELGWFLEAAQEVFAEKKS
jgi:hypothetical protein